MKQRAISKSDTEGRAVTRSLSPTLARFVTELELDQTFLVDMNGLERLRKDLGVHTTTKVIAKRLRDRGWLLPTEQVGVWEFAPGAHAGPIGRGHPFREVQAALKADPTLDVSLCLASAMWAQGLLDTAPARPEVALSNGGVAPAGLKRAARVVRFDRRLPTIRVRGTPSHRPATILVHLAARPSDVKSWSTVLDVLPELLERAEPDDLHVELMARPAAVSTRLAYLLHGIDPTLANELAPGDHGKVWFGPRGPLKRHNQTFSIADTILPISPGQLGPVPESP